MRKDNVGRAEAALLPEEFRAQGALLEDEVLVERLLDLMRRGDTFNHLSWETLLTEARRRTDVIV